MAAFTDIPTKADIQTVMINRMPCFFKGNMKRMAEKTASNILSGTLGTNIATIAITNDMAILVISGKFLDTIILLVF